MEAARLAAGGAPRWVFRGKQTPAPLPATQFIGGPFLGSTMLPGSVSAAAGFLRQSCDPAPPKLIPFFWLLKGKKGAMRIFSSLMGLVTNNVEFFVKPKDDGTDVGVSWTFVWKTTQDLPGRECSFDTAHVYRGGFILKPYRNVELLLDPMTQVDSLSKRLMAFLRRSGDPVDNGDVVQKKTWWGSMLLVALLLVTVAFLVIRKLPH
ncbi:unnamed protein product [Spirodela intermedia]|uniref:Uncharacterized protein n=1 Tax=Spirodela intermedia TaxID=51605 RepID=A0A7I8IWP6_SPIIN|nr:unnamed protein product [Spirodela intermedia]CAA6661571.1 unnamed protein product [Spirodela intermedia]